jgi:phosphatidylethanolamine-binding protein (PEBP) family uncharacterized protein
VGHRRLPRPRPAARPRHFKLYALSAPITLPSGADKLALERAMSGLVIARADLFGTYER